MAEKAKFPGSILQFWILNKDETAIPAYYGFMNKDGNWYIMQANETTEVYRYFFGTNADDYPTYWANRPGLTYGYPHEAF